jgi:hypothetical protein
VKASSVNAGSDEPAGGFLTTTSNNFHTTSGGGHLGRPRGTSGVAGGNVLILNDLKIFSSCCVVV